MTQTAEASTKPRTKPAHERRDDLMNAAQELFLEAGIGPTTIEQITARASVAKGSFYLQYSSKEDIHAALGERFIERYVANLDTALGALRADDWSGRVATWAEVGLTGFVEEGPLVNMLFHAHPRAPDNGSNLIVDHLRTLLEAGAAHGAWSLEDPGQTATFMFGGLHSIADEALAGGAGVDTDRLVATLRRLCFRLLGLAT
jgi:AcrR family transcriptional regulator